MRSFRNAMQAFTDQDESIEVWCPTQKSSRRKHMTWHIQTDCG